MDNEIIDSALSEVADAPVVDQAEKAEPVVDEGAETDSDGDKGPSGEDDKQPLPKAVVNAMERQKRNFGKLYAKHKQLEERYAKLEELVQNGGKSKDSEPTEDDFDSYSDFLEAKLSHRTQKQIQEALEKGRPSPEEAQKNEFAERRMGEVAQVAQKMAKQIPDFTEVIDDYDGFDDLPTNIQTLLLHAENPPLAAYNLIKSGRMDALASLPEALAAAEIVRAQADNPIRKVSQAPAPTTQPRSSGNKTSLEAMTPDEVIKAFIR